MTPALVKSDVPLIDLQELNQPWSVANNGKISVPELHKLQVSLLK